MPHLPRRIHRHPRQHGDGLAFEGRPPLPLVDEEHLILRLMAMHRDGRTRQQSLCPHAEGAAGPLRVNLNDKSARTRRPELEDLPFRMRGRRRVGWRAYFLHSPPLRWQGHTLKNDKILRIPATPMIV